MERAATNALQAGETLTSTETAYHTAMQAYVAECRGFINQGDYHLPPVPQLKDFDGEKPSDQALQYIMGHSNITMTLNYYAHATFAYARAEMERLAA